MEQAIAVGRLLKREIRDTQSLCIESSPLGRALETAALLCREIGVEPTHIRVAPLLAEYNCGEWEGMTREEIEQRNREALLARETDQWNHVVPGGESYAMVFERATQWLKMRSGHETIVAVTHAMMSRTIQGAYAGLSSSEILLRSHPHDRFYRLDAGRIEEFCLSR
jgi:probable phosphoglycerate mutase